MKKKDDKSATKESEKRERELIEAVRSNPDDFGARFALGAFSYKRAQSLMRRGRYGEALEKLDTAIASFERAVAIDRDRGDCHSNLGIALYDMSEILSSSGRQREAMEKLEEAVESYGRAIAIDSSRGDYHSSLGLALHDMSKILSSSGRQREAMEKLEEAVESHGRAIAVDSSRGDYHSNLGIALRNMSEILSSSGRQREAMEKLEEAVESHGRAIAIDSSDGDYHSNLGIALGDMSKILSFSGRQREAMEKLEDAVESHGRAIAIDSSRGSYHSNLGIALHAMSKILSHSGRHREAMEKLEEAVESYGRAIAVDSSRGNYHSNLGNALRAMSKILSSSGRQREAMEKLEEAVESYGRAIAIDSSRGEYHSNLGIALDEMSEILSSSGRQREAMEKLEEAVGSYGRAIAIDPNQSIYHRNKASALFDQGNKLLAWSDPLAPGCFAEALESLLAAARLKPEPQRLQEAEKHFRDVFYTLTKSGFSSGDAVAAILRTGLDITELRGNLDPMLNSTAALNLAIHFREMERPAIAVACAQQALRDPSLAPAAAALLAQILIEDLDRPSDAVGLGTDFLTRNPVDPESPDDHVLLAVECAGCLSDFEETERFLPVVFRVMEGIEPAPEREAAFCDLVDAAGAALRIGRLSGDDPEASARRDDLKAKTDRKVYESIGAWKQRGFFSDPDDDIGEDYMNMTREEAEKIRESQKKWAAETVMSYLEGLGDVVGNRLADETLPVSRRLADAYEAFREEFMIDAGETDRQIVERAFQNLERMFLVLLPAQLATERIGVEPADIPGAEASTCNLVAVSALLLEQCTGPGLNYGLAVLPLAVALEEEFRAKMLEPMRRAAETGGLGSLDFQDAFCAKDTLCARYGAFLEKGVERFAFGHMTGTWELLTGIRRKAPGLLQAVAAWMGELLEGTPLTDEAVHGVLKEINRLRNNAAHPGKPPVEEAEARRAYAACMEALSESHPFGLIPEFAEVKAEVRISLR